MRLRRPDSVLGQALRFSLLIVLYAILAILVLILVASFVGPIPLIYADLVLAIVLGVIGFFVIRRAIPSGGLKVNKPEEWVAVGALVATVFGLGQTLLALATFYSPTVTQSKCIDPINATSSNCRTIQTTSIPQFNFFGNYGALVLQITVIWVLTLVGISGLFYILYAKPKS